MTYVPEPDSYWKNALKDCCYYLGRIKDGDVSRGTIYELGRYLDTLEQEIPTRIEELREEWEEDYVCEECEDRNCDFCDSVLELEGEVESLRRELRQLEKEKKSLLDARRERDEFKKEVELLRKTSERDYHLLMGGD
jgi:hypothetical protein